MEPIETLSIPTLAVSLDCAWCGAPVELALDGRSLSCAACSTVVELAPDAARPGSVGHEPRRRHGARRPIAATATATTPAAA
jgi:hypothetical protein